MLVYGLYIYRITVIVNSWLKHKITVIVGFLNIDRIAFLISPRIALLVYCLFINNITFSIGLWHLCLTSLIIDFDGKVVVDAYCLVLDLRISGILTICITNAAIICRIHPTLRQTSHIVGRPIPHSNFTIVDFKFSIADRLFSLSRGIIIVPI